MCPCIISKNTGDSNLILINDGLTINLTCEQASLENSGGKRIFWFTRLKIFGVVELLVHNNI